MVCEIFFMLLLDLLDRAECFVLRPDFSLALAEEDWVGGRGPRSALGSHHDQI